VKDLGSQDNVEGSRRKRKAKGKVDYTDTGNNFKKRDNKAKKKNKYADSQDVDSLNDELENELDESSGNME